MGGRNRAPFYNLLFLLFVTDDTDDRWVIRFPHACTQELLAAREFLRTRARVSERICHPSSVTQRGGAWASSVIIRTTASMSVVEGLLSRKCLKYDCSMSYLYWFVAKVRKKSDLWVPVGTACCAYWHFFSSVIKCEIVSFITSFSDFICIFAGVLKKGGFKDL